MGRIERHNCQDAMKYITTPKIIHLLFTGMAYPETAEVLSMQQNIETRKGFLFTPGKSCMLQ